MLTFQDFFFRFPWNNFLHNVVYDVVQQVFNGSFERGYNRTLAIDLFCTSTCNELASTADITQRILDGQTASDNLALSCAECNGRKGSDLASLTSTGRLVALFHPRRQRWSAHLRVQGGQVEPLTPVGEVTVRLLDINNSNMVCITNVVYKLRPQKGRIYEFF